MKPIRRLQKTIKQIKIPSSSLQFQLTLELVILSVIGLGSVAFWAGWQMEQNLVTAHKHTFINWGAID